MPSQIKGNKCAIVDTAVVDKMKIEYAGEHIIRRFVVPTVTTAGDSVTARSAA